MMEEEVTSYRPRQRELLHVDPTPPPPRARVVEQLCTRVFCQSIVGNFAILFGTRLDARGREQKVLYLWNFPTLSMGADIFKKLSRRDAVLIYCPTSEEMKYHCLSASLAPVYDPDIATIKIAVASPQGLECWHVAYYSSSNEGSVVGEYSLPLTHMSTALEWSADGECIFSAQRSRIMIWDQHLGRIGSIDHGVDIRGDTIPSAIHKLLYLAEPKEIIVAAYENGTIQGWYLESGTLCLSHSITSATARELSRGVYASQKSTDLLSDVIVSYTPLPSSSSAAAISGGRPSNMPRGMMTEHAFFTVVVSFQSGRIKKVEAEIMSDTDIANHTLVIANNDQNEQVNASTAVVRELACLDLQKEMRYKLAKATTSSSGGAGGMMQEGGGGIALRRELVANVLSLVMLRPTSSTDETGSSSSNSQAAVGYLALLGDAILVLNQNLLVLDTINTGFKGSMSAGIISVALDASQSSWTLRIVTVQTLTAIAYVVSCPLQYFLQSNQRSTTSSTQQQQQQLVPNPVAQELHLLAAQLSLHTSATSSGAVSSSSLAPARMDTASGSEPSARSGSRSHRLSIATSPVAGTKTQSEGLHLDFFLTREDVRAWHQQQQQPHNGAQSAQATGNDHGLDYEEDEEDDHHENSGDEGEHDDEEGSSEHHRLARARSSSNAVKGTTTTSTAGTNSNMRRKSLSSNHSTTSSTRTMNSSNRGRGDWEAPRKDTTTGRLVDLPVTFHTKIKSSGYGQETDPWVLKQLQKKKQKQQLQQRSMSAPRGRATASSSSATGQTSNKGSRLRQYPLQAAPCSAHMPAWDYPSSSAGYQHNSHVQVSIITSGGGTGSGSGADGMIGSGALGSGHSAKSNRGSTTLGIHTNSNNNSTIHSNKPLITKDARPIFHVAFSGDASRLAIASQAHVVTCLRLPRATAASQQEESVFLGHNHSVHMVAFSHHRRPEDRHTLLTASADASVRLWRLHNGSGASTSHGNRSSSGPSPKGDHTSAAAVVFSHTRQAPAASTSILGPTSSSTTNSTTMSMSSHGRTGGAGDGGERNRPFTHAIKHAQFFDQDRFVLLTHKASLHMYKYSLDAMSMTSKKAQQPHPNDLLPRFLQAPGDYRRVLSFDFQTTSTAASASSSTTATSCTALGAMNSVPDAALIIVATSDKSLQIVDVTGGGRILRVIPQAHEKAVCSIALAQPSAHAPLPRAAYQTFATMATDNVACLWDLRQATCIQRLPAQHVHRRETLHAAWSPCMQYLAVPSEDRIVRIFDWRAGKVLAQLSGHRDVVTCVAYNPLFPQLATASYDGSVRFYCDPHGSVYHHQDTGY